MDSPYDNSFGTINAIIIYTMYVCACVWPCVLPVHVVLNFFLYVHRLGLRHQMRWSVICIQGC